MTIRTLCFNKNIYNLTHTADKPQFMKKHFKIKHQILQILSKYQDSFPISTSATDRMLHYSEIEKKIPHVDKNYLLDILDYLTATKDIYCSMEFDNSKFLILPGGRVSYLEGKYPSLGSKESRDKLFDILKIVSTAILLLIAMYSVVINIYETKQNRKDLENIKTNIEKLHLKS